MTLIFMMVSFMVLPDGLSESLNIPETKRSQFTPPVLARIFVFSTQAFLFTLLVQIPTRGNHTRTSSHASLVASTPNKQKSHSHQLKSYSREILSYSQSLKRHLKKHREYCVP